MPYRSSLEGKSCSENSKKLKIRSKPKTSDTKGSGRNGVQKGRLARKRGRVDKPRMFGNSTRKKVRDTTQKRDSRECVREVGGRSNKSGTLKRQILKRKLPEAEETGGTSIKEDLPPLTSS